MRVLYDGRIYSYQVVGGISRYFSKLVDHLPPGYDATVTVDGDLPMLRPSSPDVRWVTGGPSRRLPYRLREPLVRHRFRRVFVDEPFNLLHPTYYSLLSGGALQEVARPIVLTVYDMTHERFPDELDLTGQVRAMKRSAIAAASRIICISATTRADLLDHHPWLDPELVEVIHLAPCLPEPPPAPVSTSIGSPRRPYLLHVGARGGYKNFATLLAAMAILRERRVDLSLTLVGPRLGSREAREIDDLALRSVVTSLGPVSDPDLAWLHGQASALVYPSRYEGFGLPVIEAMALGLPVVAARAGSIPEVAGPAALLHDPGSPEELADHLSRVTHDEGLRRQLVEAGRVRAAAFDWRDVGAETAAVYRSAMG